MANYRDRPCARCGNTFKPAHSQARYCSTACFVWARVDKSAGPLACWPWTGTKNEYGYGIVQLRRGKFDRAHRLTFQYAGGNLGSAEVVCHRCDNPPCCNPAHLFAGTMGDNTRDMIGKGRQQDYRRQRRGEAHPMAKLTEAQAREIKHSSLTALELSRQYGVSRDMVYYIKRGKNWAHLEASK